MSDQKQSEDSENGGVSVEMVLRAHARQREAVNDRRREVVRELVKLGRIHGAEAPEDDLLSVLNGFREGVLLRHLKSVFPEDALPKARESLKAAGKLEQLGKRGDDVILKSTKPDEVEPIDSLPEGENQEESPAEDVEERGEEVEPARAVSSSPQAKTGPRR